MILPRVLLLPILTLSPLAANGGEVFDVIYRHVDGVELRMDLAMPEGQGPFPAIICLHGGGWSMGNKKSFHRAVREFAAEGYVAATVQYRLAPQFQFPAPVDDARAAIRFLRANAGRWKIDPSRMALMGASAGAHLALLAAFHTAARGEDAVQAVIDVSGPTDLRDWRMGPVAEENLRKTVSKTSDGLLADLLGSDDRASAVYAEASPVTQVRRGLPPVLIFQWKEDQAVAAAQAERLAAKLAESDVLHEVVWFAGKGHALHGPDAGRIVPETVRFLKRLFR